MLQMMAQMSEQLEALRTDRENDRADRENDKEAMRTQIQALQSAIATPATTPQPPLVWPEPTRPGAGNRSEKRKPTLPDPQRFNGNRKDFRTWQLEMQSKLRVDGPAIGDSFDQFAYIFARLDKTPQGMAAAFFEKGVRENCYSPSQFMDYLATCYGDPNGQQRAMDRLEGMHQKDRESFATFLPRFEKELADSGGATWDDVVRISHLKRSINSTMREELVGQLSLPTTYPEYVNALQSLGSNLEEHRIYTSRKPSHPIPDKRGTPRQSHAKLPSPEPMDWERTKVNTANSQRKAKWVSDGELQERRERRVCLRCGRKGHFIKQCNQSPATPPTRVSRTRTRFTEEDMEDPEDLEDLEDQEDSGKE